MLIHKKPKLRISLYKYGFRYVDLLKAFKETAEKQHWSSQEIEAALQEMDALSPLKAVHHLLNNYCVIVRMPKGVRVKNGKIIH